MSSLKQRVAPQYKGVTTEGPGLLRRKGSVTRRHRHIKESPVAGGDKNKKSMVRLSTHGKSKLRNQLAILRQSSRPIVDEHAISTTTTTINVDTTTTTSISTTTELDTIIPPDTNALDTTAPSSNSMLSMPLSKVKSSALVQALQWNKLKSAPRSFGHLSKRSFLFSVEQIRRIDKITIYYIALSGLGELCEMDARFEKFHNSIFSPQEVLKGGGAAQRNETYDRSMVDNPEEISKVDREIIEILRLLTPYFLLECAHKVLEFLIRYYKIHLNYTMYCLECCLPYHRTTTFARFIQLLEFYTHEWQLLFLNCQKEGAMMDTQVFVRQCIADVSILQFVRQMAENVLSLPPFVANGNKNKNFSTYPHSVTFLFYVNVVIRLIRIVLKEKLYEIDRYLLQILPSVIQGLSFRSKSTSKDPECIYQWYLACAMIANYVVSNCKLDELRVVQLLDAYLGGNSEHFNENTLSLPIIETMLLSIDRVLVSQNMNIMPSSTLDRLIQLDTMARENNLEFTCIVDVWNRLALKFDLSLPFIVAKQLMLSAKVHKPNKSDTSTTKEDFLMHLLMNFKFNQGQRQELCNSLISQMLDAGIEKHNRYQHLFQTILDHFGGDLVMVLSQQSRQLTKTEDSKRKDYLFNLITSLSHDICNNPLESLKGVLCTKWTKEVFDCALNKAYDLYTNGKLDQQQLGDLVDHCFQHYKTFKKRSEILDHLLKWGLDKISLNWKNLVDFLIEMAAQTGIRRAKKQVLHNLVEVLAHSSLQITDPLTSEKVAENVSATILNIISICPKMSDVVSLLQVIKKFPQLKLYPLCQSLKYEESSPTEWSEAFVQSLGSVIQNDPKHCIVAISYLNIEAYELVLNAIYSILSQQTKEKDSEMSLQTYVKMSLLMSKRAQGHKEYEKILASIFSLSVQCLSSSCNEYLKTFIPTTTLTPRKTLTTTYSMESLTLLNSLFAQVINYEQQSAIAKQLVVIFSSNKFIASLPFLISFFLSHQTQFKSRIIVLQCLGLALKWQNSNIDTAQMEMLQLIALYGLNDKCHAVRVACLEWLKDMEINGNENSPTSTWFKKWKELIITNTSAILCDSNAVGRIIENWKKLNVASIVKLVELALQLLIEQKVSLEFFNRIVGLLASVYHNPTQKMMKSIKRLITAFRTFDGETRRQCIDPLLSVFTSISVLKNNSNLLDYVCEMIIKDENERLIASFASNDTWTHLTSEQQMQVFISFEQCLDSPNLEYRKNILSVIMAFPISIELFLHLLQSKKESTNDETITNDDIRALLSKRYTVLITKLGQLQSFPERPQELYHKLIPFILEQIKGLNDKLMQMLNVDPKVEKTNVLPINDRLLQNVDLTDLLEPEKNVFKIEENTKDKEKKQERESEIQWIVSHRRLLLSVILTLLRQAKIRSIEMNLVDWNTETLVECIGLELSSSNDNLIITLVTALGQVLPQLLLDILLPFFEFLEESTILEASSSTSFRLMEEFMNIAIPCVAPLLNKSDQHEKLEQIILKAILLFVNIDEKWSIQLLGLLLANLHGCNLAIPICLGIVLAMTANKTTEDSYEDIEDQIEAQELKLNLCSQLLVLATRNDVSLQLRCIFELLHWTFLHPHWVKLPKLESVPTIFQQTPEYITTQTIPRNVEELPLSEFQLWCRMCLQLTAIHLKSRNFVEELSLISLEETNTTEISGISSQLFELMFGLYTSFPRLFEEREIQAGNEEWLQTQIKGKSIKDFSWLSGYSHVEQIMILLNELLDIIRGLFNLQEFGEVMQRLLVTTTIETSMSTRVIWMKGIDLLIDQIEQRSQKFTKPGVIWYWENLIRPLVDRFLTQPFLTAIDPKFSNELNVLLAQKALLLTDAAIRGLYTPWKDFVVVSENVNELLTISVKLIPNEQMKEELLCHILLCCSSMVSLLGSDMLAHLNPLMDGIVHNILPRFHTNLTPEDEPLLACVLVLLEILLNRLSNFMVRFIPVILRYVLSVNVLNAISNVKASQTSNPLTFSLFESSRSPIALYLDQIVEHIGHAPCEDVLDGLKQIYPFLIGIKENDPKGQTTNLTYNEDSIVYFFKIVRAIIGSWKKEDASLYYITVFEIFQNVMDIRLVYYRLGYSPLDPKRCETIALETFVEMVFKLKDTEMMDLMHKMVYWIEEKPRIGYQNRKRKINQSETEEVSPLLRSLTFFRLMSLCLMRFRHAFCKVALFSFRMALQALDNERTYLKFGYERYKAQTKVSPIDQLDILPPPNKKRRLQERKTQEQFQQIQDDKVDESSATDDISTEDKNKKDWVIERSGYILQTITITLQSGKKDGLIDSNMFLLILPTIIGQIKTGHLIRNEIQYVKFFETHITPCIVALADNTKQPHLWRQLNNSILDLAKDKNPSVRCACVDILLGLFAYMGHAWLNCLPETLHAIDELLQDSNEEVEHRTRLVTRKIEELTGNPINRQLH